MRYAHLLPVLPLYAVKCRRSYHHTQRPFVNLWHKMLRCLYPIFQQTVYRGLSRCNAKYSIGFRAMCPGLSILHIELLISGTCDLNIDWGDGQSDTIQWPDPGGKEKQAHGHFTSKHEYEADGYYIMTFGPKNGLDFSVEFKHEGGVWLIDVSVPTRMQRLLQDVLVYIYT